MQPEPTREALIHAVKRMHAAKGRYHSQHATCDLYELLGLPCTRETIAPPAALASAPAAEPVSPMAKMAQALRDKAAAEKASFDARVQSGEWGPVPEAWTEADCQPEHVAQVEGDPAVRILRWNKNVGAFDYPVGTKLYAASAALASAPAAEPVAGQCRFSGADWGLCGVEHVAMVLAAPDEWKGYEVRYLYAAPVSDPQAQVVAKDAPGQDAEEAAKWREHVGKLDALVTFCPTCCEGKAASADMTRDEVIFQCGRTSGKSEAARAAQAQGGTPNSGGALGGRFRVHQDPATGSLYGSLPKGGD